jgi:two-component system OmpR family response regulator/two-component system response regulator RstA
MCFRWSIGRGGTACDRQWVQGTANRILMVEDDAELASLISEYMTDNGFVVEVVADGDAAERAIRSFAPDIVTLDVMVPNRDGLQICRDLRQWFRGPVLMLTARSSWVDEIVGLELGADDYLGKPVEPRLFLSRVRALLRRSQGQPAAPAPPARRSALRIEPATRTAYIGERALGLTDAEYDLLVYLKAHAGQPLTRDQLTRDLTSTAYDGFGRTIDVRISRLRVKLGDDGKQPLWIKAIRGVGYLFVDEAKS